MLEWFKKFFIPQAENDYKPNVLEKAALMGMMVLVLLSFSIANFQSIIWVSSEWLVSTILPAVVTDATNEARADEGRAPLLRNSLLDEAARLKAEDMARGGYFAHWSPTGVSPWHWFNEAGYSYVHAGENLAVHFTDSGAVVEAWMNSPTHRDNILNNNYTEIGIGSAEGQYEGYDTVFVVQMFGAPAAPVPAESVVVEEVPEVAIEEVPVEVAEIESVPVVAGVESESVGVTESGTVVYESFAATVNETATAVVTEPEPVSFFGKLATSPRLVLQILYGFIGGLVIVALLLAIVIEYRRQHPVQLAYGFAMLAFMVLLFQIHTVMTGGILIA